MSGLVVMSPSPKPIAPNPRPVDPGVSIGHVHLKVADLNRWTGYLCFERPLQSVVASYRQQAFTNGSSGRTESNHIAFVERT